MNRSLKLSMLIALALGSSQVSALDLGQVQVKSTLGQPLLAEIPLHPANPAELQGLTVQLASSEDFARAGIAGGRTKIPLHFSIVNTSSGQRVIRITSSVTVDDPYLDLLVEVNSRAAGKSVREFAILLDPPGTPEAPAAAAATASTQPVPSQSTRTALASAPRQHHAAPAPKAEAAPAAVSNGKYGPVERGQTLSSIARNEKPAGVDINQMLLALKQANPDAFYRDNINALKTGAILRVPTSAEAQAMTVAAAVAAVRRENGDWRAGTAGKPTTVADAAARSSASSAPTGTSSASGDRLALVPAKDVNGTGGPGGGVGAAGGKSAASLRQDLLRTQESLASLEQQGNDLKTRLKDLTDINSKNEHLLSLKDSQIAELQSQLAAARKATGMPALAAAGVAAASLSSEAKPASAVSVPAKPVATAPAARSTPIASAPAATGTVAGTAPVAAGSAATTATPAAASTAPVAGMSPAASAAVARPVPVKPATKSVVRPVTKQNTAPANEQPWYMQAWAWVVGAIVILLLLATLFRRRKSTVASLSKSPSSLADRFESTSPAADHESGDDVDQNELLDELAEHPDDIHLHLELVTLYYSRRDVEHFEAAAEAMYAHITDPQQDEWQDVVHMGEDLVPGHPLFDQHAALPQHEETEARHDFDIDDYAADSHASTAASSMPPLPPQAPKKVSEYNFKFDLSTAHAAGEPAPDMGDMSVVAPPASDTHHGTVPPTHAEPASSWHFDDADNGHQSGSQSHDLGEFNDDPVDTKLDLARAYLDMGDSDGARAMLGEVLKEGSQMQQDVAKRLLETLH